MPSRNQCRFYWIVEINLVNRTVRLRALLADAVYKRACSRGHDLVDLAETERRAQSPRQTDRLLSLAFCHLGDGAQSGMHLVNGEAHRVREFRIQQEKLSYPQWPQFCRVILAVSFKSGAGFQQADPLEVFFAFYRLIQGESHGIGKTPQVGADEPCHRVRSLNESPQLNVLPALAVRHGGVGYAVKQVSSITHRAKKHIGLQQPPFARSGTVDLQIKTIQLFPHCRAALLAHLAQILPRRRHAGEDGRLVTFVQGQNMSEYRGVDLAIFRNGSV